MKLKLLPIALLAVVGFTLAGCTPEASSTSQPPVTTTTTEEPPSTTTTTDPGPSVTKFEISNKADLTAEWHVEDADRLIRFDIEPAANPQVLINNGELVITSSNTGVVSVLSANLHAVAAGQATITATYAGLTDTVEITVLEKVVTPAMKIAALRDAITAEEIVKEDEVVVNGIISSYFESPDHTYAGAYIQDGPDAISLYAGSISKDFEALGLKLGDKVRVEGALDIYNGLEQIKPTAITLVEDDTLQDPQILEVTDFSKFNKTDLAQQSGRLVKVTNVPYIGLAKGSEISIDDTSGHHYTVNFGTAEHTIPYYVNYHAGKNARNNIAGILRSLEAGDTVDLYGVISWYNAPQISPVYMSGRDAGDCIVPTTALDTPTAVSIDTTDPVYIDVNTEFSATVTPSGANQAVLWSVDDTTVAEVDQYTGIVKGLKEGTVNLTATSRANSSVKVSKALTVTAEPVDPDAPIMMTTPVAGQYIAGMLNTTNNTTYYMIGGLTDPNNAYYATSTNPNEAMYVTLAASGDGWTMQLANGKYIAVEDGTKYNNPIESDTPFVWTWNSEYNTFTAIVDSTRTNDDGSLQYPDGREIFLGTYGTFGTIGVCDEYRFEDGNYPLHLYSYTIVDEPVDPNAPVVMETPVAGQYIGGLTANDGKNYYVNGETTGSHNNYLDTDANANNAMYITLAASGEGWTMQFASGKYIGIGDGDEFNNIVLQDEAFVWTWNSEYQTFTATVTSTATDEDTGEVSYPDGREVYMGTYSTFTTISRSDTSYMGGNGQCYFHLYTYTIVDEPTPEPTPSELMATLDFSEVEQNQTVLTVETLQTILNSSLTVVDGKTLTVAVSSTANIYAGNGTGGYFANQGGFLKAGTGSKNGSIVLNLSSEIVRVEIDCVKWNDSSSDEVTVNGVTLDVPAYENETFGTLGFNLSATTQLEITTAKRCFIKAIRVYCATTTVSE